MHKNEKGFHLYIVVLLIALAGIAVGAYLVLKRQKDPDVATRLAVGSAVNAIKEYGSKTQTTPQTLDEIDYVVSEEVSYSKVGDSSFLVCATFIKIGSDGQTPWIELTEAAAKEKSITTEDGASYWEFTESGPRDSVRHSAGKNCYFGSVISSDGFVNKGGTVCGQTYDWRYEDRKVVSATVSSGLRTLNVTHQKYSGLERTIYIETTAKIYDIDCTEVAFESIQQNAIVTVFFKKSSNVYASAVQIK